MLIGLINWKVEKGHIECYQNEDKNWEKRGIFGHTVCDKHQISFCQECENEHCSSTPRQRAYCSKKCMDELEDKEERQYWLKKATREEIYSELERRKSLHKKEIKECWECHKKTDDWEHEYDDNYQCRDCHNDLIEWNKEWEPRDKKKKIKCSECGKTKLLGYHKSYYTVYCKDCWEFIKKRDKDCYEWCAEDCPFKIKNEQKARRDNEK